MALLTEDPRWAEDEPKEDVYKRQVQKQAIKKKINTSKKLMTSSKKKEKV